MKFSYRTYTEPNPAEPAWTVHRPVVPIILRTSRKTIRKLGLVDTGSDFTLLPTSLGEALGIAVDSRSSIEVVGVGDAIFEATPGEVEFELTRRKESFRWAGRVHLADQDYLLLGNDGFLEFFIATFDWADRSMNLVPNSRFPKTGLDSTTWQ